TTQFRDLDCPYDATAAVGCRKLHARLHVARGADPLAVQMQPDGASRQTFNDVHCQLQRAANEREARPKRADDMIRFGDGYGLGAGNALGEETSVAQLGGDFGGSLLELLIALEMEHGSLRRSTLKHNMTG